MAILTIKHYTDIIDGFVSNIVNQRKAYYVFIGKPDPWLNNIGQNIDDTPPKANTTLDEYELSVYSDINYGKKIMPNDVAYMVPRNYWTTGTVYDHYDQNEPDLYNKKFFVVNDKSQVYKCIFNNYDKPSTVKPDLAITTGTFSTIDGYVWKYMYTIDPSSNTKFTTTDYMPLVANADVKSNAVNGSIDYAYVTAGGIDYRAYTSGYLTAFVNNYVVQLSSNASGHSNLYSNSAIYLKAGYGAGQIRNIRSYNGLSKQVTVTEPFDNYGHIELTEVNNPSSVVKGMTVTQILDSLSYNYVKGYFNVGDTVVQTDTLASGQVAVANTSTIKVIRTSSNNFSQNLPIYNSSYSGTSKTGTVTVVSGSNSVSGSSTSFTTDYAVNDYIRVGTAIRRVTSITNNSALTVDTNFVLGAVGANHYNMPQAANPSSISIQNANGTLVDSNLSGLKLSITNAAALGVTYTVGETVTVVDVNNQSQLANGIVSYANTTDVILSSVVNEPAFVNDLFILGASSLQKAQILNKAAYPNITISSPSRPFLPNLPINFRPSDNQSVSYANATVTSFYYLPNELTEYVISPAVVFDGDGTGAIAYSTVDPTVNAISSIVMVNTGINYTYANISIVSNSQYGTGAAVSPIISPVLGHGYDAEKELGARYAGISVTFDNISNEGYKFPGYGQYRKIGILENPLFDDVTVTLNAFDRATLQLDNVTGTFTVGETVLQSNNNATGTVVNVDGANLEIKTISGGGAWVNAVTSDNILGCSSGATANVTVYANIVFATQGSTVRVLSETTSGASAKLVSASQDDPTTIKLTSVSGFFDSNDYVYDPQSNAYANVTAIYISNGAVDVTDSFGKNFSQTARVTLSSYYGQFQKFEYLVQDTTNAAGRIIDMTTEVDVDFNSATGSFVVGDTITDEVSGATGIVTFANTSYLKLTAVNGTIGSARTINNGTVTAYADAVYKVLVLDDLTSTKFQRGSYKMVGQTTKAYGFSTLLNTITYPDLIRESGAVTYLEFVSPFERSNTSNEKINLIIKI